MKLKTKILFVALLCLITVVCVTGCGIEPTPYEINNPDNYTDSDKFDANGGTFTTNTTPTIVDSYNVSEMKRNSDGDVEIMLISPDNTARGNDAFNAINNGYFLAGWYAERIENGKDSEGNPVYTYSHKWDFENEPLKVDPESKYNSEEPVLTLYAAWVPMFEYEFYTVGTGEYVGNYTFNPMTDSAELSVPCWDEESGSMEMYKFAERAGYTFNKAYYDNEAQSAVDTQTVTHPGYIDYETGTAVDSVYPIYIDWMEGEWYHISTVEQFLDNASINGSYEILADLDFEGEAWPTTFMYGEYKGEIKGNGHTLKNMSAVHSNGSKANFGLFGKLASSSKISDITFENVAFEMEAGSRKTAPTGGLFAGTIDTSDITNVSILRSTFTVNVDKLYFTDTNYELGLVCGLGDHKLIGAADITWSMIGESADGYEMTVDGNVITISETESQTE